MKEERFRNQTIAVLMGGLSAEREVSLATGQAVLEALRRSGYRAEPVDAGRDLAVRLREMEAGVAFVALHGRFGEDGTVQGLLEVMGLPYTGSGVLASSLAMDKVATKKILRYHEIPTPDFTPFHQGEELRVLGPDYRTYPVVVKPAREGSTIGIGIARRPEELAPAVAEALKFDATILVEDYVSGREVTVGVLDGEELPVIEIVSREGFYDYRAKYTPGQTEYLLPAPLERKVYERLQRDAVAACRALGCSGAARVDFRVREDGEPFCLEVNTIPGMTATSLLPKAAAEAGIGFDELVVRILQGAGIGK